jgi:hypothetical protein
LAFALQKLACPLVLKNSSEIIADNLSNAGGSWGYVLAIDSNGRAIWIAEAHRSDGKRFVVRADEKLTAFLELESAIRAVVKQKLQSFSQNVWSDVAMEFAKHKNGHHPHF